MHGFVELLWMGGLLAGNIARHSRTVRFVKLPLPCNHMVSVSNCCYRPLFGLHEQPCTACSQKQLQRLPELKLNPPLLCCGHEQLR